jgi:2-keto-3-deoxy-L-rhamnonate aldolase RhmA
VPGIDIAVIGLDDLSLGMGIVGQWDSPEFRDAEKRVLEACQRHGVLAGVPGGDPQKIAHYAAMGFRVFWCASDLCCMWAGVRQQFDAISGALGAQRRAVRRGG